MVQQEEVVKMDDETDSIPPEILEEARELCRGTEVLPEGAKGLAKRIKLCRDQGRQLRVKLGVDPTHTDLHIGHAVLFRKLRRFQDLGHKVVLIIGGFTAQIGDPSGRNSTRPPLTAEDVKRNAETYLNQIGVILDLEKTEVTNNADWLAPMNLNDLLKLAGRVTTNQLLAKEAFGDRLDKQLPVFFHELFYPLLQGYDSVAIKSDIELGGTDQRFNILMGRELQPHYGVEPQLAMFLPLLEGTDGEKKMSKSYNNYIGLKDEPDDMFGKCMRIPDHLLIKYFELATSLTGKEIDQIKEALEAGGNPKDSKERLAEQVVRQYHGDEVAKQATSTWQRVHSQKQAPEEMPSHVVSESTPLFRVLVESQMCAGTGEAKRLVQEGGVRIDGEQARDPNLAIELAAGESKVVQVGRRKFVRLTAK
ncbi:MAG: tyrosine--tRNA ligase [Cyanobacteria bacterium SZAS-4]|nr:tyrosine--tRNA ligase [Cyanobacteria bacterium SZAS-4]